MIGVAFAWTANETFLQQWEYALSHFHPDVVYVVAGPPPEGNILRRAVRIDSTEELPRDVPLVLLAPPNGLHLQGDTSLETFTHPPNAIYYFGSDARHLEVEAFSRQPDYKVFVPTDSTDQMYSFAVWLVVAWDRRCKS